MLIGALVFIYLQNYPAKTLEQKSQISKHKYLCMHTKLYLVSTIWEMSRFFYSGHRKPGIRCLQALNVRVVAQKYRHVFIQPVRSKKTESSCSFSGKFLAWHKLIFSIPKPENHSGCSVCAALHQLQGWQPVKLVGSVCGQCCLWMNLVARVSLLHCS